MPRPRSGIDEFRDEIVTSYEAGVTVAAIYKSVTEKGCACTIRTLERRMKAWGLSGQRQAQRSDEIVSRIKFLFIEQGLTDEAIQQDLADAGFSTTLCAIKHMRVRNGMKRRYRLAEERAQAKQRACNQCRRRKRNCSGQKPTCSRCRADSLDCSYAPKQPSTGHRRPKHGQREDGSALSPPQPPSIPEQLSPITERSSVVAQGHFVPPSRTLASRSGPSSSSNFPNTQFSFRAPSSVPGNMGEQTRLEYGEATIFSEAFSNFGVDLNTLWSTAEVSAPSSNGRTTTYSTMDSHAALDSTSGDGLLLRRLPLPLGHDGAAEPKCTRQCMNTITPLPKEADDIMQKVMPKGLDRALSWLKKTVNQCMEVLQCQICLTSFEKSMVLLTLCGKLIVFSQSLLRHTLDMSNFPKSAKLRDYKIGEREEMATVFRLLCGHQVAAISKLLAGIKSSPALEGNNDQSTVIRNIEQQVAGTLAGVKSSLVTSFN
ncbi:hypothetical protein F4801DRAFT_204824 [Xylaria longipes]|nr:hypothetical protein F4801DRAFT_204824 [Xylaria longipes]